MIIYFVINIMKKTKSLTIVKYSKKLQKRMNLNINSYKDYSQLYSLIELELKLIDDKCDEVERKYNIWFKEKNNTFINILDEEKEYYHIYFDNSKEEIKRNFLNKNEKVNTIKIIIDYQVKSFKKLFLDCNKISSIKFKKFYRINITDMSEMFSECTSLYELNLSNFNTNNVTNMSNMFYNCKSLNKLNLSNFNTKNVTDMSNMFCRCFSLHELNVSNFNTKNVTSMKKMFNGCAFGGINLSNFNTSKVTDMSGMFWGCQSLNKLNISNFNTNNVTNMSGMFGECKSIKELNLSNLILIK